ncbi:MAG: bifunctional DNA primase/polymerase [Bacteroidota bacterium]
MSFRDKARRYREALGWPVFPLHGIVDFGSDEARCTCGRVDCERPGKHPRIRKRDGGRGMLDATTDADQIDAWDELYPDANLAMPTGAATGIVVVDIDGEDGAASVAMLARMNYDLPATATVFTGRGRHLYYRCPAGLKTSASKLAKGIDIRADGGQVVLPPSRHIRGTLYRWAPSPLECPLQPLPLWVPRLIDEIDRHRLKEKMRRYDDMGYGPQDEAGEREGPSPSRGREGTPASGPPRPMGQARPGRSHWSPPRSGPPSRQLPRDADWARRRIAELAQVVATTAPNSHQRNHTLNRQAFIAFRIAHEVNLRETEVEAEMMRAARACGLSAFEAMSTIQSARHGAAIG